MRTTAVFVILLAAQAGCSKRCPPGQLTGKGGKCFGNPIPQKQLTAPRRPPPKPRDLAKRPPLAAPELKPLAVVARTVFGGKTPRWFASAGEVRQQTGLKDPFVQNTAWNIGIAYSLPSTPVIDGVSTQVDYLFLGDNLIAYDVWFFAEDEKSHKLQAALRAQAEKAYGPPKSRDAANTDWLLPQLAVHMAVIEVEGLTKVRGHPVHRVQVSWTVPPASIK